ncbi:primosomal replication protein [Ferrimonas senticii]|uniref:primosomal replication protein n=1 Tax=Ferrimonas senticii TaxID=394566 RepID=UPI00041466C9|nr:primosomal replication protein [Ferrimonas senticii]
MSIGVKQLQQLRDKLTQLEQQLQQHDASLSDNNKKWLNHKSRFHEQLFEQQGATLSGCMQVLKRDLKQIEQLLQINASGDALALACQRFSDRFEALVHAMANTDTATRGLQQAAGRRRYSGQDNQYQWIAKSVMNSSHQLYAELRKHQNWESQLQQKITVMEQQLDIYQGTDKIEQQQLILKTHARLGKCRQAMSYIEQRIAWLEKNRD